MEFYKFFSIYQTRNKRSALKNPQMLQLNASALSENDEYQLNILKQEKTSKIEDDYMRYLIPDKELENNKKLYYKRRVNYSSRDIDLLIRNNHRQLRTKKELDRYFTNLVELLYHHSQIYKLQSKYKLSYFYMEEASRICEILRKSSNPFIIELTIKIQICLGNFYFELARDGKDLERCYDNQEECLVQLIGLQHLLEQIVESDLFDLKQDPQKRAKLKKYE